MVFRLLMLPLPPNSAMVTAVAVLGEAELAADLPFAVGDLVLQLLLLAVGLLEVFVILGVDLGELPQLVGLALGGSALPASSSSSSSSLSSSSESLSSSSAAGGWFGHCCGCSKQTSGGCGSTHHGCG
jgi:hypothetical protein